MEGASIIKSLSFTPSHGISAMELNAAAFSLCILQYGKTTNPLLPYQTCQIFSLLSNAVVVTKIKICNKRFYSCECNFILTTWL